MICPRCGQEKLFEENAEGCRDRMCPVTMLEIDELYEEERPLPDRYYEGLGTDI